MIEKKKSRPKIKIYLIGLLALFILLPIAFILVIRMESDKPTIKFESSTVFMGVSQEISIDVGDLKSGLKKVWFGVLKDGKETVLAEKDFPSTSFLSGSGINSEQIVTRFEPKKLGITDGKAIFRISARDHSWRGFMSGNFAYLEKEIIIDTKPPTIDILTKHHNISQGGAGLVIYRIPEKKAESGVYVGDNFFPGHSGYFDDEDIYMAFFALGFDQSTGSEIFIKATDQAGNSVKAGFYHYTKKRVFKKDTINIPDSFLKWKMPEFDVAYTNKSNNSLVEKFIYVNREVRKENTKQISGLKERTGNTLYWEGAFLRMPKSANRANFADHRVYKHKGRIIDKQNHMGVDLASLAHSAVPAANRGMVIFTGNIGIFGKTVVIDHGFGLFSMYSHLSQIMAQEEQVVSKGDSIGRTGVTGLAGGDHLHFGMFIHDTFVNPIEWWDASWIKNNVTSKIDDIKQFQ